MKPLREDPRFQALVSTTGSLHPYSKAAGIYKHAAEDVLPPLKDTLPVGRRCKLDPSLKAPPGFKI